MVVNFLWKSVSNSVMKVKYWMGRKRLWSKSGLFFMLFMRLSLVSVLVYLVIIGQWEPAAGTWRFKFVFWIGEGGGQWEGRSGARFKSQFLAIVTRLRKKEPLHSPNSLAHNPRQLFHFAFLLLLLETYDGREFDPLKICKKNSDEKKFRFFSRFFFAWRKFIDRWRQRWKKIREKIRKNDGKRMRRNRTANNGKWAKFVDSGLCQIFAEISCLSVVFFRIVLVLGRPSPGREIGWKSKVVFFLWRECRGGRGMALFRSSSYKRLFFFPTPDSDSTEIWPWKDLWKQI